MTKIIVTENQLKQLTKNLKEDTSGGKYRMECKVDLNYYGAKFKGFDVDDISTSNMFLTFDIDMLDKTELETIKSQINGVCN